MLKFCTSGGKRKTKKENKFIYRTICGGVIMWITQIIWLAFLFILIGSLFG